MALDEKKSILLTFDVEDWFQVENFKGYIEFSTWNSFELRVEKNTFKILDLLDSFSFKPKATFFILGWIAEKLPHLVCEIHMRGHEVASHGFDHKLCNDLSRSDLIKDLKSSKEFLEEIIDTRVHGFRAPSFAINNTVLKSIQGAGYTYDSSYNSFSSHGRYGTIDLSQAEKIEACHRIKASFFELPISNLKFRNKVVPFGGGGYFRLFPFFFFKFGMRSVLKNDKAFVFYAHPWEFDPGQPRVEKASRGFKFRHYVNLSKTESKLKALLYKFRDCNFITCMDYIRIKSEQHSFPCIENDLNDQDS
jgi:polysaccharide deacetylase family protein (PEP-CTERM system associated)